MHVTKVLQDGSVFDAKVLDLSADAILAKFQNAVKLQASLSLGAAYPTSASAPHTLLGGFKNLVAASAASGYTFKEADALLNAAKKGPAPGAAAEGATAAAAAPVEEKEEEAEVDAGTGNLFGDEDEY